MDSKLLRPMKGTFWNKPKRKPRRIEKRWTHVDVDKLVDLVEPREIIWNPKNAEYKNSKLRTDAFAEIAKCCNRSLDDCKAKWGNLRAQFRSYGVNLQLKKTLQPTWRFYERMAFLNTTYQDKRKQTSYFSDDDNNEMSNGSSEFVGCSPDPTFEKSPKELREQITDIEPISSNALELPYKQMDSHQIFADFLADRLRLLSANKAEDLKNKMLKWVMGAIEVEARNTKNHS